MHNRPIVDTCDTFDYQPDQFEISFRKRRVDSSFRINEQVLCNNLDKMKILGCVVTSWSFLLFIFGVTH